MYNIMTILIGRYLEVVAEVNYFLSLSLSVSLSLFLTQTLKRKEALLLTHLHARNATHAQNELSWFGWFPRISLLSVG